jgi:molybdopterin-guanine dinucleotide biosynthesis protein A
MEVMDEVIVTRESPPFGGPASAVAAGLTALRRACADPASCTLVLACDMPKVSGAVTVLLNALHTLSGDPCVDGVIAVDASGRRQPLAAVYRSAALAERVAHFAAQNALTGLSMRALISDLTLTEVRIPAGSTDDIDLWSDAAAHNIPHPARQLNQEQE